MTTATVRVRLVVEVPVRGTWGADCTVAQAQRQGIEEAANALRRVVGTSGIRFISVQSCAVTVSLGEEELPR